MLGLPPTNDEWKLDCHEQSTTLKRVTALGVAAVAWVHYDARRDTWEFVGTDKRTDAETFDLALDILWSWRPGSNHHLLCDCIHCGARFDEDAVDDEEADDDADDDDEYDLVQATIVSQGLANLAKGKY